MPEPHASVFVSLPREERNRINPAVPLKGRSAKLPSGLWLLTLSYRDTEAIALEAAQYLKSKESDVEIVVRDGKFVAQIPAAETATTPQ